MKNTKNVLSYGEKNHMCSKTWSLPKEIDFTYGTIHKYVTQLKKLSKYCDLNAYG